MSPAATGLSAQAERGASFRAQVEQLREERAAARKAATVTPSFAVGDKVQVGDGSVEWEVARDLGDKVELYSRHTTRRSSGGNLNGTVTVEKSKLGPSRIALNEKPDSELVKMLALTAGHTEATRKRIRSILRDRGHSIAKKRSYRR